MDTDRGFFRFKFWVHCLSTKWFAQRVFTVSYDQRQLIHDKLGIPLDKIGVTYNGWEHMAKVQPDESIFERMSAVKKGEYFYALGSLAGHKNFKWIREVARRSPDKTFVVAGGRTCAPLAMTYDQATHNVFYPGYVSDAENAAPDEALPSLPAPGGVRGLRHSRRWRLWPSARPSPWPKPAACRNFTAIQPATSTPYDYEVDLDAGRRPILPLRSPGQTLSKPATFWLEEIKKYAQQ